MNSNVPLKAKVKQTRANVIALFEAFLDKHETYLDSFIDNGSEHELFVSSYIHGHFSVIAAKSLNSVYAQADNFFAANDITKHICTSFVSHLHDSIQLAINNNELSYEDSELVVAMLKNLDISE